MPEVKLNNVCPVLLCHDVAKTVDFYVEKLGFQSAKHYDKKDRFASVYRDSIELVIVQALFGTVQSNTERYGTGYDLYINPNSAESVDIIYREFVSKGVFIAVEPRRTDYGSYEFVAKDIDGRLIGVGLIAERNVYFEDSDYDRK